MKAVLVCISNSEHDSKRLDWQRSIWLRSSREAQGGKEKVYVLKKTRLARQTNRNRAQEDISSVEVGGLAEVHWWSGRALEVIGEPAEVRSWSGRSSSKIGGLAEVYQ
ncbi:hypothetical protein MA16_Dca022597 [Dendrobium catenatum]|uniref:Uncharacterized protein n=1 Tax=Dendrobium catenatum TaxID=906689 RepID=A0A2I0V747_9ASPA|nr:hypothetical protein MA16_Dca022597 [Dendrobium catenatum]